MAYSEGKFLNSFISSLLFLYIILSNFLKDCLWDVCLVWLTLSKHVGLAVSVLLWIQRFQFESSWCLQFFCCKPFENNLTEESSKKNCLFCSFWRHDRLPCIFTPSSKRIFSWITGYLVFLHHFQSVILFPNDRLHCIFTPSSKHNFVPEWQAALHFYTVFKNEQL